MASRKLKIAGWILLAVLLLGIGVGILLPRLPYLLLSDGEVRQLDTPAILQKIQDSRDFCFVLYALNELLFEYKNNDRY